MKGIKWWQLLIMIAGFLGLDYLVGDMKRKAIAYNRYVSVKGLSELELKADLAV